MTDIEEQEFTKDYAGELALECLKLEKAFQVGMEEYDNSSLMLGKSKWYCLGLESHDGEKEKDSENKKNILLRLIDKVVAFIKMIAAKIVEWFKACKAAVVKFFSKEVVDPRLVASRFNLLVEDLTQDDSKTLIAKMGKESKTFLAEFLNKKYREGFLSLYAEYKKVKEKSSSVDSFAHNYEFFTELKQKAEDLKEIAKKENIYDTVDQSLAAVISGSGSNSDFESITAIFNEIGSVHQSQTSNLEGLLKKIPDEQLAGLEGDNVDTKRRHMVELISAVLKIGSDLVLKINHYMQAISMLMTYIVKYRAKRVVIIRM